MDIHFWGVRGSYPISRLDSIYFGGNTSCIHVATDSGTHVVLDGGTGARKLGNFLQEKVCATPPSKITILLTHFHWDHMLGLPFFSPFYHKGNTVVVYGAKMEYAELKTVFYGMHDTVYFPVELNNLPSEVVFKPINPGEDFNIGDISVKTMQLNHPSVTIGYRLESKDKVFVLVTDTAPIRSAILGANLKPEDMSTEDFIEDYDQRLVEFAKDADLLVYDTQYTDESILGKEHYGHSIPEDAINVALKSNAKFLIMYHHDPEETDTDIWLKERSSRAYVRENAPRQVEILASYEGMHITI